MAATLKLDENGKVVVSDGFPVIVYEDGREAPLDFNTLIGKVKEQASGLSAAETKVKALEARISKFGLPDEELVAAVEFAKANKGKKVSNEDELRERIAAAVKSVEDEKKVLESKVAGLTSRHESFLIEQAFNSPEVVAALKERKANLTPSIIRSMFVDRVAVAEDKVVPFRDPSKKDRVFSRTRHGEEATLAEAVSEWIATHPEREAFTVGTGSAGSGAPGANGANGNANLAALSPEDRLTAGFAAGAQAN
jgi:hypothetical protein